VLNAQGLSIVAPAYAGASSEQNEGSKVLDYIPFLDTRTKFLLKAFRFLAYGSE
jgi:hypothetical protein